MGKKDQPGHAVLGQPRAGASGPVVPDDVRKAIEQHVAGEFEQRAKALKDRLKYGVIGFMLFVGAMPLGGDDIVRSLHERAFPVQVADQDRKVPLISFGSGIELHAGDPKASSSFMSFYAEREQRVHLYVTITPRLLGVSGNPPRVVISVDGKPVGEAINRWVGGFKDITETLSIDAVDLGREQNVHQLGFALADFGEQGAGDVVISAIILVF
jgi:hypothetical protein